MADLLPAVINGVGQSAAVRDAVDKAQGGVDDHLSPVSGDFLTWIQDVQKLEGQDPSLKARILDSNPAVQSLVDYQGRRDAQSEGEKLNNLINSATTKDGIVLTPEIRKSVEKIQKMEADDPKIKEEMKANFPLAQYVSEVNLANLDRSDRVGHLAPELQTALDKQGGPDSALTPEMEAQFAELVRLEGDNRFMEDWMWAKYPEVQTVVDKLRNK